MIILLSDVRQDSGHAARMRGLIASIAPDTQVIDLTHDIPPGDVQAARFVLWNSYRHFPAGSIFCCGLDAPGGSKSDVIALQTLDYYFIAPDNGSLDYVLAELPARQILQVENPAVMRDESGHPFQGRDICVSAAAHLAAGFLYTQLGPLHRFSLPESPFIAVSGPGAYVGEIIYFDRAGNAVTNLKPAERLSALTALMKQGSVLLVSGSHGLLEFALPEGNAKEALRLAYGDKLILNTL